MAKCWKTKGSIPCRQQRAAWHYRGIIGWLNNSFLLILSSKNTAASYGYGVYIKVSSFATILHLISLQDIVQLLEDQLKPLVQAELSVLVDVLHKPEVLFPTGSDARKKCESGGFISRLVMILQLFYQFLQNFKKNDYFNQCNMGTIVLFNVICMQLLRVI